MTNLEFSNEFDTLLNSYRRFKNFDNQQPIDTIQFDEYEKSLFLTQAQDAIVKDLYSGRLDGKAYETTEESRAYLKELITEETLTPRRFNTGTSKDSYLVDLSDDAWFIVYEQVEFSDGELGCLDGSTGLVKPITHDTIYTLRRNPFKGANKRRVLRLSIGDEAIELISKYKIKKYFVRYLKQPEPIILVDLTGTDLDIGGYQGYNECKLNSSLHRVILEKAVNLARQTRGAGNTNIV